MRVVTTISDTMFVDNFADDAVMVLHNADIIAIIVTIVCGLAEVDRGNDCRNSTTASPLTGVYLRTY